MNTNDDTTTEARLNQHGDALERLLDRVDTIDQRIAAEIAEHIVIDQRTSSDFAQVHEQLTYQQDSINLQLNSALTDLSTASTNLALRVHLLELQAH